MRHGESALDSLSRAFVGGRWGSLNEYKGPDATVHAGAQCYSRFGSNPAVQAKRAGSADSGRGLAKRTIRLVPRNILPSLLALHSDLDRLSIRWPWRGDAAIAYGPGRSASLVA